MKYAQEKKLITLFVLLGLRLDLFPSSHAYAAGTPTHEEIRRSSPWAQTNVSEESDDVGSSEDFHSLQAMVVQLVSNTEDLREKLKHHMDSTQNSLLQLSQDVQALKSNLPSSGSHVLTAINPRLSHRNRLKQCLHDIPINTDYNNSLTIVHFPESENDEMDKLLTLYNLRACILEERLQWWVRQILEKAGIPGIPTATLYEQWRLKSQHHGLGEEFNPAGHPNPPCMNLVKLKKKASMILLPPGSCVRLYSNPNCLGENRIFASDRNSTWVFHDEIDGFDKRAQSVGKCFSTFN